MDVTESYVAWNKSTPEVRSTQNYNASDWKYTEEGYLFFEQYHMPGYDGASGHNAIRVQPLEEKYRQLNQKYILPIGYELKNVFLVDWNEQDFGQLDFYDLFDLFYEEIMKKPKPYVADNNSGVGILYEIGIEEFEGVIQLHLRIDRATLERKVSYFPEKQCYEYRPRGLYDCEEPSYPYPEVVNYTQNEDGTITLKVHAVYPNHNSSKAYAHEVVIRPLDNENYQYVSNHVIPDDNNNVNSWRRDRLTKEEWEKFYGSNTKVRRIIQGANKGYDHQVDSSERNEAVVDCKKIMAMVEHEAPDQIQTKLGELGNPVSTSEMYSNMENYRKMEVFLENSALGMQGEIVMYEVHTDWGIKGREK